MKQERPSFSSSLRALQQAQKSNKGAPLYSVLINRPLGRVFAAAAHQLGMTPNQVTAVSACFTFSAILIMMLVPTSPLVGILIAILLALGYALDAADGQLARLRGGGSLLGEWLDHVIDSFKIATLHLAVAVAFFRFTDGPTWWLLVALGFSAVNVVHFFGFLLTELLTRVHYAKKGEALPAKGAPSMLMSLIKLPTDYGLLCIVFLLFGFPHVFIWIYLFLFAVSAGYTALVLLRWRSRVAALDAEA